MESRSQPLSLLKSIGKTGGTVEICTTPVSPVDPMAQMGIESFSTRFQQLEQSYLFLFYHGRSMSLSKGWKDAWVGRRSNVGRYAASRSNSMSPNRAQRRAVCATRRRRLASRWHRCYCGLSIRLRPDLPHPVADHCTDALEVDASQLSTMHDDVS